MKPIEYKFLEADEQLQSQINYMFNKSLEVLLSDFGKQRMDSEFRYLTLDTNSLQTPIIFIKKVFILHRFLVLSQYALKHIFPTLIRRLELSSSKIHTQNRRLPKGRINWKKTISIQAQRGKDWIEYETPVKEFDTPENLLAALSMIELICHSRSLYRYFSLQLKEGTYELNTLKLIKIRAEEILFHTPLRNLLPQIRNRDLQFDKEYENFIEKPYKDMTNSYQSFCKRSEDHILQGRQTNYFFFRLVQWRRRYAKSIEDFTLLQKEEPLTSKLTLKWTANRLYEIFVLVMIAYHIIKHDPEFSIKQTSLLRPREGALFVLEQENVPYAWFHYDRLAEIDMIGGIKLSVRPFPIRPDITFLNTGNIVDSAIIDMKRHEKFSADATSQMHRYKDSYYAEYNDKSEKIVREAILCFSCDIQYTQDESITIHAKNIIEFPFIDFTLHCVSIYPYSWAEKHNNLALNYVAGVLLRLLKIHNN